MLIRLFHFGCPFQANEFVSELLRLSKNDPVEPPQQAVCKGKRRSHGARTDDDEPLPADCLLDNRDDLACLLRREDLGEDTVENIITFAIEVDQGSFGRSLKMAIFKVFHESGFLRRGSALHRVCSGARIGGQLPTTLHAVCTFMGMITHYHPIDVHGLLPAIEALVDRFSSDISRAKELLALSGRLRHVQRFLP